MKLWVQLSSENGRWRRQGAVRGTANFGSARKGQGKLHNYVILRETVVHFLCHINRKCVETDNVLPPALAKNYRTQNRDMNRFVNCSTPKIDSISFHTFLQPVTAKCQCAVTRRQSLAHFCQVKGKYTFYTSRNKSSKLAHIKHKTKLSLTQKFDDNSPMTTQGFTDLRDLFWVNWNLAKQTENLLSWLNWKKKHIFHLNTLIIQQVNPKVNF